MKYVQYTQHQSRKWWNIRLFYFAFTIQSQHILCKWKYPIHTICYSLFLYIENGNFTGNDHSNLIVSVVHSRIFSLNAVVYYMIALFIECVISFNKETKIPQPLHKIPVHSDHKCTRIKNVIHLKWKEEFFWKVYYFNGILPIKKMK